MCGRPGEDVGLHQCPANSLLSGWRAESLASLQIALPRATLRIPEDLPEAVCVLSRVSLGASEDLSRLLVMVSRLTYPEIADVSEYESPAIRTLFSVGMGVANTGSSSGGGGPGGSTRPASGQMWPRGRV